MSWEPSQIFGRHLLETLSRLSSLLSQTPRDDEHIRASMLVLMHQLNSFFEAEAQLVLVGHEACFLMNQTMIPLPVEQRLALDAFWCGLEKRKWGGFMMVESVSFEQVDAFFRAFLYNPPDLPSSPSSLPSHCAIFPLSLDNAVARISLLTQEHLDSQQNHALTGPRGALMLYSRLLMWVKQRYNPLQPRPPRERAAYLLKELIALCEGRPVLFLGFRATDRDYQHVHIANTAVLAALFGGFLKLNRGQRLELALAALEHDVGKLDLPQELLQKAGPLTDEERKAVEMLPIRTVRRLLEQRFDWGRLKHALIALDVRLRPASSHQNHHSHTSVSSAFSADPTLFFSRIISLCACFDALCSERSFREALSPAQAIIHMQGELSQQFDPILLERFVASLLPVLQKVSGQSAETIVVPHAQRRMERISAPPVIQELQRELQEYRTLKCLSSRNEEEELRLQHLKQYLIWKLKAAAT